MKNLYLLRHANTQPDIENDKGRILTPRGIKEVQSLAKQFISKEEKIDIVLCSTAVRTKETFHYFKEFTDRDFDMEYKDCLYNPSLDVFINTLRDVQDNLVNLMTISHNPTISDIANYLLGENTMSLGTANLVKLELDIEHWSQITKGCAILKYIIKPGS